MASPPPYSRPGPPRGRPVELLVAHLPPRTSEGDVVRLFEEATEPGEVRNVIFRGPGAVVRMRDEAAAERALEELCGRPFRGLRLSVRRFRTFKIFVGLVSEHCTSDDLRVLFEDFGPVVECAIVRDYAFVHMVNEEDGRAAIEHLNGMEVKGRRIVVEASRVHKRAPGFEEEEEGRRNKNQPPPYRDQPSASHEMEYRPPASSGRTSYGVKMASSRDPSYEAQPTRPSDPLLKSYEDDLAYGASSGHSFSAQSMSYGPSYGAEATRNKPGGHATSYKAQLSDSLSTRDRGSVDTNYAGQLPSKVSLASGYRAQPAHSGPMQPAPQAASSLGASQSQTAAHRLPYERVRLSPPRTTHDDYYREFSAANKQYAPKSGSAALHQLYEHVRLSPPRISHDDFYRGGSAAKLRYAAEAEAAPLRRPYERVRLSPPRSNHSAKRSRDE
nr:RNA-binding protein 14-like [Pogona vitticeps]